MVRAQGLITSRATDRLVTSFQLVVENSRRRKVGAMYRESGGAAASTTNTQAAPCAVEEAVTTVLLWPLPFNVCQTQIR
ncbi:hypothetical protein J6590_000583 [Homalodisca vitripennis]|nr:hypothetical protein J6590_000583 [Homalodisca vitripennis]